jgi:hypothetical protein
VTSATTKNRKTLPRASSPSWGWTVKSCRVGAVRRQPELGTGPIAPDQQDCNHEVAGSPDQEHAVDDQLGAREADAAEVVEDQEDEEEHPAEDLGDPLRDGPAIGGRGTPRPPSLSPGGREGPRTSEILFGSRVAAL